MLRELGVEVADQTTQVDDRRVRRATLAPRGPAELVHQRAATEGVVEDGVVREQLVVGVGSFRIGPVRVAAHLAHRRRCGGDVRMNAGRDGGVHRGAESRALFGLDHVQRPA